MLQYETTLRRNPDLAGPALPKSKRGDGAAPSEDEEQAAVVQWAKDNEGRWPELGLLYAIPNGGWRDDATAALLKATGMKKGAPDLCLPAMRKGADGRVIGGLYIEMKKRDHSNYLEPEQRAFLAALREQGYMAVVCYGCAEAVQVLEHYLSLD